MLDLFFTNCTSSPEGTLLMRKCGIQPVSCSETGSSEGAEDLARGAEADPGKTAIPMTTFPTWQTETSRAL